MSNTESNQNLFVELFFENKPDIDYAKVLSGLNKSIGEVHIALEKENLVSFKFTYFSSDYPNIGTLPMQFTLIESKRDTENWDGYQDCFDQSWTWGDSETATKKCGYSLLIHDFYAWNLEPSKRLAIFQKAVYEVVSIVGCNSILFRNSMQFIEPQQYLQNSPSTELYNLFFGILNIRLFSFDDSEEGEFLIDSIGFAPFNIPDVQFICQDVEPNIVANHIYNVAVYIFENPQSLKTGDRIDSYQKDEYLLCKLTESSTLPKRNVFELSLINFN